MTIKGRAEISNRRPIFPLSPNETNFIGVTLVPSTTDKGWRDSRVICKATSEYSRLCTGHIRIVIVFKGDRTLVPFWGKPGLRKGTKLIPLDPDHPLTSGLIFEKSSENPDQPAYRSDIQIWVEPMGWEWPIE